MLFNLNFLFLAFEDKQHTRIKWPWADLTKFGGGP